MSYIGTNQIGKMFLGSTEIAKAYLGSSLVFQKGGPAPLPYDAELEWIASADGHQYIDLGFKATQNIAFSIGLGRYSGNKAWECGAETNWSSNIARLAIIESGASNAWWRYGQNGLSVTVQSNLVGDIELNVAQRNVELKNFTTGNTYTAQAPVASNFTTPGNFLLYAFTEGPSQVDFPTASAAAGVRLKYAKFTDTGVNMDLIPVRIGSVGYMYDKNSGTFFPNAGTGAFLVGPDKYTASESLVASMTVIQNQGSACYGNYLVSLNGPNTTCWIHDISTGTLVQTISIPSAERGFVSTCHSNTVNFGTEFYAAGDDFPLLYVSTGYNDGSYSGALVYRIVNTGGTYSLSLVQTLKFPGTDWTEFVTAGNDCYIFRETPNRMVYRFAMPTLAQGDVTFDYSQALDTYDFGAQPGWYNGSRGQGKLYLNGQILYPSGVPNTEELLFIVLDLATQYPVYEIDLKKLGLTIEPEAVFIWDGKVCISFWQSADIYALTYSKP